MIYSHNPNNGYIRNVLDHYERLEITERECPIPCLHTWYDLEYYEWELKDSSGSEQKSITIGFSNFMVVNRKEYLACDFTCIIGQLGGNLGFFLGGSVLAGVDFILFFLSKIIKKVARIQ